MNESAGNWASRALCLVPGDIERMVTKKRSSMIGDIRFDVASAERLLQSSERQGGPVDIGAIRRDLVPLADEARIVGRRVIIQIERHTFQANGFSLGCDAKAKDGVGPHGPDELPDLSCRGQVLGGQ